MDPPRPAVLLVHAAANIPTGFKAQRRIAVSVAISKAKLHSGTSDAGGALLQTSSGSAKSIAGFFNHSHSSPIQFIL